MVQLPIYSATSSAFQYLIDLDGKTYSLTFRWNERLASWHMSLATSAGVTILSGVRIVPEYLLLATYQYLPGLPPGDFAVINLDANAPGGITFDNFGSRFVLVYYSPEELEA